MTSRAVLIVVYDIGSMAPMALAATAARIDCSLVFAVPDSAHTRTIGPVLEMVAPVVPLGDEGDDDALHALKAFQPDGIVTFSELQLRRTAELADRLGLQYHSLADIDAITNKGAQRTRLAEVGVDAVRHRMVRSVTEIDPAFAEIGYPCVVKPLVGGSSRNTFAVSDGAHGRAAVARLIDGAVESGMIVEELLTGIPTDAPWGDYVQVDCVARGDDVRPVFITSKFALAEPFRERGGYGARSVLPRRTLEMVGELACRATRALHVHGISCVEIKLTPSGPRVIEVNGRLGAWANDLAVRTGCTPPAEVALQAALGRPHQVAPLPDDSPLAYQYLLIPPVGARIVKDIVGISPLSSVPGVEQVKLLARSGTYVGWEGGTSTAVAMITGAASTLPALAEAVARLETADWITYESGPDGTAGLS